MWLVELLIAGMMDRYNSDEDESMSAVKEAGEVIYTSLSRSEHSYARYTYLSITEKIVLSNIIKVLSLQ